MNSKPSIRFLLATAISLGLVASSQLPFANQSAFAGSSISATADLNLKSESQLKSEAALYDTAIREIGRIADLKLAAPEDSKMAQSILDKQIPNLRFSRSGLVALGLSDSSFVSAAKAKAGDKKSADQFAQDLSQDSKTILKLSGAQSLADRIRSRVAADTAMLRKIAELLKRASAEITAKPKAHHAVAAKVEFVNSDSTPSEPLTNDAIISHSSPDDLDAGTVTILVVAVAVIACPPLGLALFDLASAAYAVAAVAAIAALAALLVDRLIVNLGTDQGRDKVAACQHKVDGNYRNCMSAANKLPFPINVGAGDGCYAQWLLDSAGCLVTN